MYIVPREVRKCHDQEAKLQQSKTNLEPWCLCVHNSGPGRTGSQRPDHHGSLLCCRQIHPFHSLISEKISNSQGARGPSSTPIPGSGECSNTSALLGSRGFAKPSARSPAEISARARKSWSRMGPESVDRKTLVQREQNDRRRWRRRAGSSCALARESWVDMLFIVIQRGDTVIRQPFGSSTFSSIKSFALWWSGEYLFSAFISSWGAWEHLL